MEQAMPKPETTARDNPCAPARRGRAAGTRVVNLALQGGGAHGAFTWGVLDRLLEDERIDFDGISATSAGAMNAAVFAYGLSEGGRQGAKKALANFWRRVSHAAAFGPLQPSAFDRLVGNKRLESSPSFLFFDMMTRLMSPYQFNPLNLNPLRDVLKESVDFEMLRRNKCRLKLFLSATNVRTGKVKIFGNDDIQVDSVLASACLPFMFQAVEIDGEAYWDGGYMGNPCIFPLIYECQSADVVVVHINPLERRELPRTASEILSRINEISFNSSLMREMRAIAFVTKLIDEKAVCTMELKRLYVHGIAADDVMQELGHTSKLNADWQFLTTLRDIGRERAAAFLNDHHAKLGRESTVDIRGLYL